MATSALKARRTRADGADGLAATHANIAAGYPALPAHLDLPKEAMVFWEDIMRARAIDEWGRIELTVAWELAWVLYDLKTLRDLVRAGDRPALDNLGLPSINAASKYIGMLQAQHLALMRALQIVGNVVGDPADEFMRRSSERESEQTINRLKKDAPKGTPLLAL